MGEAAGTAADLAIRDGVQVGDVPIGELQRRLELAGAFLGDQA
jgi:hypothetical protein